MSFLRSALIVAGKDLKLEWRTFETLSATGLFALIVLVVFNFAFDLATVHELGHARLVPGVLWTTVAFAAIVGFARSFQIERRRESLTALALAPVDHGALFIGKSLANFVLLSLLEILLLPMCAVLFDWNLVANLGPLALVVALHSLGLTLLGTLFAAITARLGRGEALLATLLLPAATPLFLSAVRCTNAVLDGRGLAAERSWLLLSGGFAVLYLLVSLIAFEFVLED